MTVAELIELLKQQDPGTPVVVAGYEGGYHDISLARLVRMIPDANKQWYYGAHEEADETGEQVVTALLLFGKNQIATDG